MDLSGLNSNPLKKICRFKESIRKDPLVKGSEPSLGEDSIAHFRKNSKTGEIEVRKHIQSQKLLNDSEKAEVIERYQAGESTSYEGILARRSGLTKDQVIATLDIMDAIAFLTDYNPDGYAPLNYSEPEAAKISLEDTYLNNINSGTISAIFHYNDTDHRWIKNFAA